MEHQQTRSTQAVAYLIPRALLIFPQLTCGLTERLSSGLVKLPACLFTPAELYTGSCTYRYLSQPVLTGSHSRVQSILLPPEEVWDERIWSAGTQAPIPGPRPKHHPYEEGHHFISFSKRDTSGSWAENGPGGEWKQGRLSEDQRRAEGTVAQTRNQVVAGVMERSGGI